MPVDISEHLGIQHPGQCLQHFSGNPSPSLAGVLFCPFISEEETEAPRVPGAHRQERVQTDGNPGGWTPGRTL